MSDDQLKRVLIALQAIYDNAPDRIDQEYVSQYHEQLDRLTAAGYEVNEWRIPAGWLKPRVQRRNYITGAEIYTEPLLDQYKFFTKLQAVLGFFTIEGKKVGFEAP
jgi:hypothetical protein